MTISPRTEKAGGVVVRHQGGRLELYLIHRPRYNDWSVPKGHIDGGESPEQAAQRELREETGWQCRLVRPLPDYEYSLPTGEPVRVYMFEAEVTDTTGQRDSEVDDGRWVALEDAANWVTYPSLIAYIRQIDWAASR